MNNKKVILVVGTVLVVFGLIKPHLNSVVPVPISVVDVQKPSGDLLELSEKVVTVLRKDKASKSDCLRLANLYHDLAVLISLDEKDETVKNTEEVRQANRIAGLMLRMNINDKYPDLATSMNNLVMKTVGDDNVPLNKDLRAKAVNAFNALSWASNEGAK